MNIAFYTAHEVFEILPSLALSKCTYKKHTTYMLIFSWFTLNLEVSW